MTSNRRFRTTTRSARPSSSPTPEEPGWSLPTERNRDPVITGPWFEEPAPYPACPSHAAGCQTASLQPLEVWGYVAVFQNRDGNRVQLRQGR